MKRGGRTGGKALAAPVRPFAVLGFYFALPDDFGGFLRCFIIRESEFNYLCDIFQKLIQLVCVHFVHTPFSFLCPCPVSVEYHGAGERVKGISPYSR